MRLGTSAPPELADVGPGPLDQAHRQPDRGVA